MYTTKKVKCDKTPELDMLAHESGRVYCKVVSLLWKVKRKKGFWLSQGAVQKYMLVPIESGSREYGTWLQSAFTDDSSDNPILF